MRTSTMVTAILLAATALACSRPAASPPTSPGTSAQETAVLQLFEDEWTWGLANDPVLASTLGIRDHNAKWPDASPAGIAAATAHRREIIAKIAALDRSKLTPATALNADLLAREYEFAVRQAENRLHYLPLHHMGGVQAVDDLIPLIPFETTRDYEDWIARLRALPGFVDQNIALMRSGIESGILFPRVVIARIPAQIDRRTSEDVDASSYFARFRNFPDAVPETDRERLRADARDAIADAVVPSMEKLKAFILDEYLPACPDDAGIWTFDADGSIYQDLIAQQTTTEMTADEIHDIGLREVARIRGEMQKIMQRVGFEGTIREFNDSLRANPRFYAKTPEELLQIYRATSKRIDPEIVKVFRTMPRMPYGVTPIPDEQAPDTYAAFYYPPTPDGSRAGTYFVNLYRPDQRPTYEIMALSLHEAVPGHHFQLALAQELGEVPKFRRYLGYNAFREGWGLYAESLGDEMGLYDDPYDKYGQLTYEMWRAVRLVVDTGMHAKRWSREQAISYFRDNAAKSELDIVNEIDRYIVDPGQALAYKLGELTIKRLRAESAAALGERFDVREFHDVVLANGGVPLDVLERQVRDWRDSVE